MVKVGVRTENAEMERWGEGPSLTARACLTWRSGWLPAFLSCVTGTLGVSSHPRVIWVWDAGGAETHVWVSEPEAWPDMVEELIQGLQSL